MYISDADSLQCLSSIYRAWLSKHYSPSEWWVITVSIVQVPSGRFSYRSSSFDCWTKRYRWNSKSIIVLLSWRARSPWAPSPSHPELRAVVYSFSANSRSRPVSRSLLFQLSVLKYRNSCRYAFCRHLWKKKQKSFVVNMHGTASLELVRRPPPGFRRWRYGTSPVIAKYAISLVL